MCRQPFLCISRIYIYKCNISELSTFIQSSITNSSVIDSAWSAFQILLDVEELLPPPPPCLPRWITTKRYQHIFSHYIIIPPLGGVLRKSSLRNLFYTVGHAPWGEKSFRRDHITPIIALPKKRRKNGLRMYLSSFYFFMTFTRSCEPYKKKEENNILNFKKGRKLGLRIFNSYLDDRRRKPHIIETTWCHYVESNDVSSMW